MSESRDSIAPALPHWGGPLAVAALLLGSLGLRLHTIGRRPLWADEDVTLELARQARDVAEFFRIASGDGFEHPALHPFLTSPFLALSTDATVAVRLPSVVAGVLSVGLLVWLCSRLWDHRVAAASGLVLALSVYHINYSQDARAYPWLVVCGLAQMLCLSVGFRSAQLLALWLYPIVGIACLYLHHVGTLVQAGLGLTYLGLLGLAHREAASDSERDLVRRRWIAFAGGMLFMGVLYAPQIPLLLGFQGSHDLQIGGGEELRWLNLSPRFFHELVVRWGNGRAIAPLYEALFVVGFFALWRKPRAALFVIPWLAVPFLFFGFVPFRRFFDIRYLITALPAFCAVVGLGAATLLDALGFALRRAGARPVALQAGAVGLAALLAAPTLWSAARNYRGFARTEVRCSEVMSPHRNSSNFDKRYCRNHLVLHSRQPHARFIVHRRFDPDWVPERDPESVPEPVADWKNWE